MRLLYDGGVLSAIAIALRTSIAFTVTDLQLSLGMVWCAARMEQVVRGRRCDGPVARHASGASSLAAVCACPIYPAVLHGRSALHSLKPARRCTANMRRKGGRTGRRLTGRTGLVV